MFLVVAGVLSGQDLLGDVLDPRRMRCGARIVTHEQLHCPLDGFRLAIVLDRDVPMLGANHLRWRRRLRDDDCRLLKRHRLHDFCRRLWLLHDDLLRLLLRLLFLIENLVQKRTD